MVPVANTGAMCTARIRARTCRDRPSQQTRLAASANVKRRCLFRRHGGWHVPNARCHTHTWWQDGVRSPRNHASFLESIVRDKSASRATNAPGRPSGPNQAVMQTIRLPVGVWTNTSCHFCEGVSFADLPSEDHQSTRSPKAATKLQIKIDRGGATCGRYFGTSSSSPSA